MCFIRERARLPRNSDAVSRKIENFQINRESNFQSIADTSRCHNARVPRDIRHVVLSPGDENRR
jgi:ferritin-like protein